MTLFHYKARTTAGVLIDGTLEAADKYELSRTVRLQSAVVVHAEESAKERKSVEDMLGMIGLTFGKVSLHEKIIFIRNLSAMLEAGLPLTRGMGVLEKQSTNTTFKKVISGLIEDISHGSSLADSIKKHPAVFPPLFGAMVKAGEESGTLPKSLQIVGEHLEKSYELRKKIRGALIYPSIVLAAMIIIGILMLVYVVPTLTATFKELKVELPMSTKLIIATSDFMVHNFAVAILGMLMFLVALIFYVKKTAQGTRALAWCILHVPIIGTLAKEANAAMTTRTLSALLASGVGMTQSIDITRDVVQNVYYKDILLQASAEVEKGVALSEVLGRHPRFYLPIVTEMTAVGEETGKLADMLMRIATFFEDDVNRATKDMSTIIEPFLMVIIGGSVGFFAMSMLGPMYSLSSSIG